MCVVDSLHTSEMILMIEGFYQQRYMHQSAQDELSLMATLYLYGYRVRAISQCRWHRVIRRHRWNRGHRRDR